LSTIEFTPEAIGTQGKSNAESLWLATISFFVSKGDGLEDWINHVGKLYAE
jgi:hypothetical protein